MRSLKPIRMKRPARKKPAATDKRAPRWWGLPAGIVAASACALVASAFVAAQFSGDREPAPSQTQAIKAADRAEAIRLGMPAPPASSAKRAAATADRDRRAATAADETNADSASEAPAVPVTIVGCLEQSAEAFRLKDTAGENVPRARSWKSGFLTKRAAPIEVVDAANRLKLSKHVGERVSVTGVLVDRRMTVRSMRRVAASCEAPRVKAN